MDETPPDKTPPFSPPPFSAAPDPCDPAQLEIAKSKKVAAGVLGILLGSLGIHKFVLGYQTAGIIMLAVTIVSGVLGICLCIPWVGPTVMYVIGLVEGITYLTKSDEDFCRTYIVKRREWF